MPLTPEDHAFHEDIKGVLMKHQEGLRTTHMAAILAQVAGSTIAIEIGYDGMSVEVAEDMLARNGRVGISTGLAMIAEHHANDS